MFRDSAEPPVCASMAQSAEVSRQHADLQQSIEVFWEPLRWKRGGEQGATCLPVLPWDLECSSSVLTPCGDGLGCVCVQQERQEREAEHQALLAQLQVHRATSLLLRSSDQTADFAVCGDF